MGCKEDVLRNLGPEEVKQFLTEKKVSEKTIAKLIDEDVNGNMLMELSESALKEVIGALQAKYIKSIIATFLDKPKPDTGQKSKKQDFENVREFGKSVQKMEYKKGNLISHEIGGGSLLEPAREFKEFCVSDNLDDLEIPFIKRVAKFANACLNRRCNGTIYFGVGDSNSTIKIKEKEFKHGEIVGMDLSVDQVEIFEDWVSKYLRGTEPQCFKKINNHEMKKAADLSISPIRVVQIENSTRLVLEIDIEPSVSRCREIVFPIQIPNAKGVLQELAYYKRDGAASNQIPKKEVKQFTEQLCLIYVNERRDQESHQKLIYADTSVKLSQLLCRSENCINDEEFKYFLITDSVPQKLLLENENLNWIPSIDWQAIFDFDFASFEEGLGKHITPMMLKKPQIYQVQELSEMLEKQTFESVRKEISHGYKCNWLICNEQNQDFKLWAYKKQDKISKALNFFTHVTNAESKDKMVFVFALYSEQSLKKMSEVFKSIIGMCGGFQEIVCLYQEEAILRTYQERLVEIVGMDDWNKYSVKVSWVQLSSFVKARNMNNECTELLIPSSSGIPIILKPEVVKRFMNDGISILGINQCDELRNEPNALKQEQMAKLCTQEFLTGKNPPWEVFMLSEPSKFKMRFSAPNGLVERIITKRIQEKIQDMEKIENKSVALAGILHNPGAGATTVGKHVLWNLRDRYRCAYLDGAFVENFDFHKLSEMILLFRKISEEDSLASGDEGPKCKTVLLFLDNSSLLLVKKLRQSIERAIDMSKISYTSTLVIILHAERSIDLIKSSFQQNDFEPLNVFPLKSYLEPKEKESFQATLQQLTNYNYLPIDMLSFVIMAEDFNEDSEYVHRVVGFNLKDISQYPRQERLLMVLSVYKYFSDGNLPVSLCDRYLGHSKVPIRDRLCCNLKPLVEVKSRWEEGYGDYKVLQITHLPVAKQILDILSSKNSVNEQSILLDYLDTDVVQQPFLRKKITDDIRTLLSSRMNGDVGEENKKLRFSKLILHISKQSSAKAFELLAKGYETLDSDPVIAQTIARFFNYQKSFEEAKQWGQKAVTSAPHKYTFLDTMGRIYKDELKELKEKKKINTSTEIEYAIGVAKESVTHFRTAIASIEKYQNSSFKSAGYYASDETYTYMLHTSPYYGEIDTNLLLSDIILNLTDNLEHKKSLVKYFQGMEVGVDVENILTDKVNDWRQFESFLTGLDGRTMSCMNKILSHFDSSIFRKINAKDQFDPIQQLTFAQMKREKMYFGKLFTNLHNRVKSNNSVDLKLELIRKALNCRLIRSMIYCFHRSQQEIQSAQELVQDLFALCEEKNLMNEDKIFLLNTYFAEHYILNRKPNIDIKDIRAYTFQLAMSDFPYPEPFFYYMIMHWPNEDDDKESNTEYTDTYDEQLLFHCIQQLKKIQDQKSISFTDKNIRYEKSPYQRPFYFLAKESGFRRLDIVPNGGIGYKFGQSNKIRKILYGKISCSNDKRITYQLPKGKQVEIRPQHHRWLQASKVREISFELGFTFAGPLAYNIKEVNQEYGNIAHYNALNIS